MSQESRKEAYFPMGGQQSAAFSYDLGGLLRRGDLEGQNFYAEVKNYRNHRNHQADEYVEYLAKSYCTYKARPHSFTEDGHAALKSFLHVEWQTGQPLMGTREDLHSLLADKLGHPGVFSVPEQTEFGEIIS